jgi:GDPmannose 4,6-dehydratase
MSNSLDMPVNLKSPYLLEPSAKKKALIFGITGQDGSYLAEFLIEKGYEVSGVVRRSSVSNEERLLPLWRSHYMPVYYGDVTDTSSVYRVIEHFRPDEVYNLAAQSNVKISFDEPFHTHEVVARGAMNILDAIQYIKPEIKYYQASSSEMFGDSIDLDGYQRESTPFSPQSPYGLAKLHAHQTTKFYRTCHNIFACSGILFNHESERRSEAFLTRKVTSYVAKLVCGKTDVKLLLGNLEAYRDWGYAPDYVEAIWKIMQHGTADDFVVATGTTRQVKDFVREAFAYVNIKDWERFVSYDNTLCRKSEVNKLCGDASKAKRELGWEPRTNFQTMIQQMINHDIEVVNRGKP